MKWWDLSQGREMKGRSLDTRYQTWLWAPTLAGWNMLDPVPGVVPSS